MPATSPRVRIIKQLHVLIALWLSVPVLRSLVPQLLAILVVVKSTRYLASRKKPVEKAAKWDPGFLGRVRAVRAKRLVRMDAQAYAYVVETLRRHPVFQSIPGKKQKLPFELDLQVFLMFISTSGVGGSYNSIAQRFGIGEGKVRTCVGRVVCALCELSSSVITWPSSNQKRLTRDWCNERSGFADCVGFIDGTAFNLQECPTTQGAAYYSRKSRYCIAGTAVCDQNRRFIAFYVGETGCAHDARQLRQMELYNKPSKYFEGNEYVIGDCGYPLREFLITPYKRPAADDAVHGRYNTLLSRVRIRVEQSFGILKERFCRLKEGFATVIQSDEDHKFVCDCIEAAVVLHNLCIDAKDTMTAELERDSAHTRRQAQIELPEPPTATSERVQYERALVKRQEIEDFVIDKDLGLE